MKKIILLLLFLNFLFATPIQFKEECYKYNLNKQKYILNATTNLSLSSYNNMNYIANILTAGIKNCDDIKVYYDIERKDLDNGITIQKVAMSKDFVTLKDSKDSFLVGVLSRNLGLLTAYNYLNYQQNGYTNNKPTKRVVFELKKVNFINMYLNYIQDYCKANQVAPYMVYNELDFLSKTNEISESKIDVANPTGLLRFDNELCKLDKENLFKVFTKVKTHGPSGTSGFKYTLWGDKWFLDNGFTVNYPFKGYDEQIPIFVSYLTTYMFRNNIDRGLFIVDTDIKQSTNRWTTGKWPWEKEQHSRRTLSTGVELYSLTYTGYITPLKQYGLNKDYHNEDMSLVAVINQLPALSKQLTQYTQDGHVIEYAYKKGTIFSNSHSFSRSWEVSKKMGTNWIQVAIIVIAVVALIAVGAAVAAAYFAQTAFVASIAIASGTGVLLTSAGIAIVATSIASIAIASSMSPKKVDTQDQTAFYSTAAKNLLDQIVKSPSTLVQEILSSSLMFSNTQTTTIIKPQDYKTLVKYSPILKNDNNANIFSDKEWLLPYGNYLNYKFYAYRTDLGENFYSDSTPAGISNSFYYSMKAQNNDLLTPIDVLKQVIKNN